MPTMKPLLALSSHPFSRTRRGYGRLTLASMLLVLGVFAAPISQAQSRFPRVAVQTSMGDFIIELYPDKAPQTVQNFLAYVNAGFYNGTIFHRVMANFMIQGGGFTRDMQRRATRPPIPLESQNGLRNDTGWVAMARTASPNSATAQFFINVVDNPSLNFPAPDGHGYAAFGKVIQGMDTVNKIRYVATHGYLEHRDVPISPIIIDKIVLEK
jgi:peptidyl-prolyl cis-trans isomerase A (cyclophilin A)